MSGKECLGIREHVALARDCVRVAQFANFEAWTRMLLKKGRAETFQTIANQLLETQEQLTAIDKEWRRIKNREEGEGE